ELGPELHRLLVVLADGGAVAADADAELQRRPERVVDPLGDLVGAGDDALEHGRRPGRDDRREHAGGADRPGPERRQRGQLARDLVTPAPGRAGLVVAAKRAVLDAEDVLGGPVEVGALEDLVIGLVDLGELAAAALP